MRPLPKPCNLRPHLRLPPIVRERHILRQRPVLRAVHIEIVREDEPRLGTRARREHGFHRRRPHPLPKARIVIEPDTANEGIAAGSGALHALRVEHIGRNELRRCGQIRRPLALHDADLLAPRQKQPRCLAAHGPISQNNDLHRQPPLRRHVNSIHIERGEQKSP